MAAGQYTNKERDFLKTHSKEGMKMKFMYDGTNRMQYVYEAPTGAAHGDPCLLTTYAYVGATSRVDAMKETQSTWDSSWDI